MRIGQKSRVVAVMIAAALSSTLRAQDADDPVKGSISLSLLGALPFLHANVLAEYLLDEKTGLGFNLSYGNSFFSSYQSKSISIQGRRFVSSSFYTAVGLSYIDQYTRFDELDSINPAWFIRDHAIGLRLAIGSQKNFPSGFFIGAEWAEAGIPIVRVGRPVLSASEEVDAELRAEKEQQAKHQRPPFEAGAARFFLGQKF